MKGIIINRYYYLLLLFHSWPKEGLELYLDGYYLSPMIK